VTADKLKLVLAMLIVAVGIGGFYYLGGKPELYQWAALLVAVTIAAAVALRSAPGRATWEFAKGARAELRKVVWPNRKETMQMTLIVFVLVVLVALFLWGVDWALLKIVKGITG
jgi:preprotein translocase subunit SecE